MIKYVVRSKELLDIVNEIKSKRLVMSPYFQRNLVWRQIHKIDFIKTILMEYPIPQIFIAKGSIDLDKMLNTSCIVDGQQRLNSIMEYISGEYKVDNVSFSDLDPLIKEKFLKYQIPIIDLDIDNNDPQVKEIFKRLNRTFYSLTTIEKLSTEYAPSELMLLSKLLINEITPETDLLIDYDTPLQVDPLIPDSFIDWSKDKEIKYFNRLILNEGIFTPYEISRQVHLMFTLNLVTTIKSDFYNRNEFLERYLDDLAETFDDKDQILESIEKTANFILKMKFKKSSYWYNKANLFTIIILFFRNIDSIQQNELSNMKSKLEEFEKNLPDEYRQAAKEGVNNKKERLIRFNSLNELLF